MTQRNILLGVIALLLIIIVGKYVYNNTEFVNVDDAGGYERISGSDLIKLKEAWAARIKKEGPQKTYAAFLSEAPQNTEVDTHTQAHLFGEALYKMEGIDAVKYCDSSFEFGCYHSFFGMAVYEEGIGVLPQFDQACKDAYGKENLPCQHGIGHGLLIYTDYENLEDALDLCETISWQPTGGCSSGVFMEYNFHTMESVNGEQYLRPLSEDVYAPCSTLPEKHQPSCYAEQVQWWENVFNFDYEKIGVLCNGLPAGTDVIEACFHGVGNYIAASSKLEPDMITTKCALMPDEYSGALCHEGASWLVRGPGTGMEDATKVCDAIKNADYKEACISKLVY